MAGMAGGADLLSTFSGFSGPSPLPTPGSLQPRFLKGLSQGSLFSLVKPKDNVTQSPAPESCCSFLNPIEGSYLESWILG